MNNTNISLNSATSRSRARLALGSALTGSLALMALAIPGTALAANECGLAPLTAGTVTCTPTTNPNTGGVSYIAPPADLTIVLQDGVRIDTTGGPNSGVLATSNNALVLNGGTNTVITTSTVGSDGARLATTLAPLAVTLDRIATTGANANGVTATSVAGPVTVNTRTVSTVGADAAAISAVTVSSPIAITSGTINTTGADATGIRARSTSGAIAVSSGPISTTGAQADAINVASTTGTAAVNAGAITTIGAGANGIVAAGGSGANVAFTTISTTGANAHGVLIPAGVPASASAVVNGGSVSTAGAGSDGVRAIADTGTATVNVTGNIATQGASSRGIFASGPMGVAVTNSGTITTTGATANGVDVSSAVGPVSVSVRNVTTTGNGSQAVLVNAPAGNATVAVSGALRTTGTAANALTVNSGGNSVINLGSDTAFSTVQGDFVRLNAAGTSTLNTAATIGNNAAGYAVVATGGPITINNTGNLNSDIVLTGGADVINNAGTFTVGTNPDFGAGVDTFNNAGLVTLIAGVGTPVSPVFNGLESLNNSGTIELRNNIAGDTLTLPGTYAGTNGTLGLDMFSNGTALVADQLIVGGAATGTTTIALNQMAGSQPVFNAGTVLVNAGAGTSANAFGLAGGGIDAGFVRYQVGYDAAGSNFVLTAAPSDTAFRTMNYAEGIRSLWLKSADAVSAQLRARRDTMWSNGGGDTTGRFWMQIHGSKETREGQRDFNAFGQSRVTDTGYKQDYFGAQVGLDISGGSGERGGFAFGVTGGYLNSAVKFPRTADRLKFDVVNAGVYASYSAGNLFFNALGKYDRYWAHSIAPSAGFKQDYNGDVYGARAELGLRLGSDSFFIEPAASISYVKNGSKDLTPMGTNIAFNEDDGLRARFGGRIGGAVDLGGPKMSVYTGLNYVHEFKGRDTVVFSGGGQTLTYTNDRLRDYGEATLGMTIAQNETVSGFLEANYLRSFNEKNGQLGMNGVGGRAGVRFRF